MKQLELCHEGELTEEKARKAEEIVREIEKASDREEKYWSQRSRIARLETGDQNSKFFHTSIVQRRQRNKILKLKKDDKGWIKQERDIAKCFANFYTDLFSHSGPQNYSNVLDYVHPVINDVDNEMLLKPVSKLEIKEAVFQLGGSKAHGPDSFSASFTRRLGRRLVIN